MPDEEARPGEDPGALDPWDRRSWDRLDPLERAAKDIDRTLGEQMPAPSPDWLAQHLQATGEAPGAAPSPAHHHRTDPPYWAGTEGRRGAHRDGHRPWWRFWRRW